MRLAVVLVVVLCSNSLFGQTAYYAGRAYTPESYPQATWHNCGMCDQIRSQWRSQGWVSGFGANKVMSWQSSTAVVFPQVDGSSLVLPKLIAPQKSPLNEQETAASCRTVTKYRTETYQYQVCVGKNWRGQCIFQTRTGTRQVPYMVQEPVAVPLSPVKQTVEQAKASPKPTSPALPKLGVSENDETSPALARRVLEIVRPGPADVVVDLGCANGSLLAAAAPYGCRLIGVEINEARAKIARWRIPSAEIIEGDLLKQDYSGGTIFLVYLFPDVIEDVLDLLPAGSLLVSLENDIPGIECEKRLIVLDDQSRHFIYTATIRDEVTAVAATFGL